MEILQFQIELSKIGVYLNDKPYVKEEFYHRIYVLLNKELRGSEFKIVPGKFEFDESNDRIMTIFIKDKETIYKVSLGEANIFDSWYKVLIDGKVKADFYTLERSLHKCKSSLKTVKVYLPCENGENSIIINVESKTSIKEIQEKALQKAEKENLKVIFSLKPLWNDLLEYLSTTFICGKYINNIHVEEVL